MRVLGGALLLAVAVGAAGCTTDGGAASGSEVREVVVTGSRLDSSDRPSSPSSPPPPPPPAEAPPPPPLVAPAPESPVSGRTPPSSEAREAGRAGQSGLLTAGDYDDLLNPGLYADFVQGYYRGYGGPFAPEIDTARRVTVEVKGADTRPVLGAKVRLRRLDGSVLERPTAADGKLVLHPALDGLPERVEMTVTAPSGGAPVRRTFAVTPARRSTTVNVNLPGPGVAATALDLLLVVDTTGSMGDELNFLKAELADIAAGVSRANPRVQTRLGLIVYRDVGDEYVVRHEPFTADIAKLQRALDQQEALGGGDTPEAVDQALEAALQANWRPDAVKALVLVADAPPHEELAATAWRNAMSLRDRGVHIVPVAASGVRPDAEYLMRAMAAATQSRYVFLTDDSGVGLQHGEPDVDCYLVTRLDGLLRRVLNGLVAGRRIEPTQSEIIREVGDYDAGVCRGPS